jgi:hypothetical protein
MTASFFIDHCVLCAESKYSFAVSEECGFGFSLFTRRKITAQLRQFYLTWLHLVFPLRRFVLGIDVANNPDIFTVKTFARDQFSVLHRVAAFESSPAAPDIFNCTL